jgi:hypothetical protein
MPGPRMSPVGWAMPTDFSMQANDGWWAEPTLHLQGEMRCRAGH